MNATAIAIAVVAVIVILIAVKPSNFIELDAKTGSKVYLKNNSGTKGVLKTRGDVVHRSLVSGEEVLVNKVLKYTMDSTYNTNYQPARVINDDDEIIWTPSSFTHEGTSNFVVGTDSETNVHVKSNGVTRLYIGSNGSVSVNGALDNDYDFRSYGAQRLGDLEISNTSLYSIDAALHLNKDVNQDVIMLSGSTAKFGFKRTPTTYEYEIGGDLFTTENIYSSKAFQSFGGTTTSGVDQFIFGSSAVGKRFGLGLKVTENSSNVGSDLFLRSYDNNGALLTSDIMYIKRSTGHVGFGTVPDTNFHLKAASNTTMKVESTGATYAEYQLTQGTNTASFRLTSDLEFFRNQAGEIIYNIAGTRVLRVGASTIYASSVSFVPSMTNTTVGVKLSTDTTYSRLDIINAEEDPDPDAVDRPLFRIKHTMRRMAINSIDVNLDNAFSVGVYGNTLYDPFTIKPNSRIIMNTSEVSDGGGGPIVIPNTSHNDNTIVTHLKTYTGNPFMIAGADGSGKLKVFWKEGLNVFKALVDNNGSTYFTGQHAVYPMEGFLRDNVNDYVGMIVVSAGTFMSFDANGAPVQGPNAIDINEALPVVKLSSAKYQSSVFGVITNKVNGQAELDTEDTGVNNQLYGRIRVNGLGEGGIWVCSQGGDLKNGDYICTSDVAGVGMKQDDDVLHNYTVAKITCDCRFNDPNIGLLFKWKQMGNTICFFVGCTYHCS